MIHQQLYEIITAFLRMRISNSVSEGVLPDEIEGIDFCWDKVRPGADGSLVTTYVKGFVVGDRTITYHAVYDVPVPVHYS